MTVALLGEAALLVRGFRLIGRQPVAIAMMIIQPVVWLLIYGQLFHSLPQLGGFGTSNYLAYLAPGIAIFTAFNHGAWEGGGVVQDIERGTIDRFLATPLPAGALLSARALQAAITGAGQALFVIIIAMIFGADLHGGILGLITLLVAAVLVCIAFAAFNQGLALLVRRLETMTLVGVVLTFPLMFTSTMFTSEEQLPMWMRQVAAVNPVNWAVEVARSALINTDWTATAVRLAALAALVIATEAFALLALSRYRRSL